MDHTSRANGPMESGPRASLLSQTAQKSTVEDGALKGAADTACSTVGGHINMLESGWPINSMARASASMLMGPSTMATGGRVSGTGRASSQMALSATKATSPTTCARVKASARKIMGTDT